MDPEMVMEVPDTPERTAFTRPAGESSLRTSGFEDKPSSSNQCLEPTIRTYSRQMKNSGFRDFNGSVTTQVDGDFLFSQAKLARLISDTPDTRATHVCISSPKPKQNSGLNDCGTNPKLIDLSQDSPSPLTFSIKSRGPRVHEEQNLSRQSERNQINGYGKLGAVRSLSLNQGFRKEKNNTLNSCGKEKDMIQQLNSRARNEQLQSRHLELKFPQREKASSKSSQEEAYYQELINSANQGPSSSYIIKDHDNKAENGSCKVFQSINRHGNHKHQELVFHPKNKVHRRLVRNGCISPSNIANNKNDAKAKGIEEGSATYSKLPNNISSQSIQCSISEGRTAVKGKGKEVMNDELLASSQHILPTPTFRRSCLQPQKEMSIISDIDYDSGSIRIGECGTNLKEEIEKGGTKCATSFADKLEEATSHIIQDTTQIQACPKLDLEALQHSGKRKISFAHSNAGECSSSTVDSSTIPYDRASFKPSYPRSTKSRKSVRVDTTLAPIVEIDELDSSTQEENRILSDESIARSIQLESDEVLARQLQEQFYLESPPIGAVEVDSTAEFPLLEEVGLHGIHSRQNQSRQRVELLPALFGRPRFHQASTRMAARARSENRLGHIRRNFSRPTLTLEERLDLLEALEAAFENDDGMESPDPFLDSSRDFNENDYEMLLALDENNHRHVGATERQINSLPLSLIQNNGSEEACAVCLETPSVGDTIRHLPCLHKFHKDCIDTWLRRKRSCPICKSGIT